MIKRQFEEDHHGHWRFDLARSIEPSHAACFPDTGNFRTSCFAFANIAQVDVVKSELEFAFKLSDAALSLVLVVSWNRRWAEPIRSSVARDS